jgi:galactonate dehydratase
VSWGFREEPKGRLVFPGDRPGLGVDVDEAVVRKHPFEQEVPRRAFGRDGSVIDW